MFKEYVSELLKKDFIKSNIDNKGKKKIALTRKGNDFLEEYRIIENFIKNFGL